MAMSEATKKIVEQLNEGLSTGLDFGRAKWRLLERSGSRVLLLSEDIVDHAPFDRSVGEEFISWGESHLRKHMNRDLPMALFSDMEYGCIEATCTAASINPAYETRDNGAVDRLFPLSIEEVDRYFGDGNMLSRWRMGNAASGTQSDVIGDMYNGSRVAKLPGTNFDWWWLRTPGVRIDTRGRFGWVPGRVEHHQCYVGNKGRINAWGSNYDDRNGGIRPAMWLRCD